MVNSSASTDHSNRSLYRPLLLWSLPFVLLRFSLPIYGKQLGATGLEIGGLYSVLATTTLLLRPVVGWAIDRFGRKRFLVLAFGLNVVAMVLFAFADTIAKLYLARLVEGVGASFLWVSVNTIAGDLSASHNRGASMGRVTETIARGGIFGVVIGLVCIILLPKPLGWQATFIGYAGMAALASWLAWKHVPETMPTVPVRKERSRFMSKRLLNLLIVVFVTWGSTAMLEPIYLVFLQDKFTMKVPILALAFLPAGLVYSFLPSRLGRLSDRYGRVPIMAVGLAGAGSLSLALPHMPSLLLLASLYTLIAATWSMTHPSEAAMVGDLSRGNTRGKGYGVYDMARELGAAVGPLLGGWLYDTAGQAMPFYINGCFLLAGVVWVVLFLRARS